MDDTRAKRTWGTCLMDNLIGKKFKGELFWFDNQNKQFLTNDDGSMIPYSVCLCAAYSSHECVCGAWDR